MCHWGFDEDSEMHFSYLMIYIELYYSSRDSNDSLDLIKSSFVPSSFDFQSFKVSIKVSILQKLLNKDIH